MHKFYDAYAFKCDKTLDALRVHLNATTKWQWIERDGENFDYISSLVVPDYAMLKIYWEKDNDKFVLDIRYDAKSKDPEEEWEEFLAMIQNDFLPSIGATDVEEDDGYS